MPCNFFPIYLTAEKYTAMGKDWHRGCFKCTECKSSIAQGAESVVSFHPIASLERYSSTFPT